MQMQIDLIASSFLNEEKLLAVGASIPNPTEQVYITNQRIIVHKIISSWKGTKTEIFLSDIKSVKIVTKLSQYSKLEIVTTNDCILIERIPLDILQEIKRIIDELLNQRVQDDSSLEQAPDQITVVCPGCGAVNIKQVGKVNFREYCDTSL
ncbi:hypothetical protein SAMN02745215_04901 [Desulfitobacterium chlororespirans DSM 11544]|uniref:PH domain-containing protein n=2 Tax=Desulfitobacterium chlororespirans TaxID=51616 RepID=A0A1M7UX47_9FIRM|nr:hypothetical protein SAMN02745215_04901 [Desulfitobacterium chlororespirans DSM 11544]